MPAPGAEGFTVRRSCLLAGLDVAEVRYAPGFTMGVHDHLEPYLTVVVAGGYEERTPDGAHACRAGMVVFRPAGEPHSSRFDSSGALCLRVRLRPGWLDGALGVARPPQRSVRLAAARAGGAAARLGRELRAGDEASALGIEGVVLSLLAETLRVTTASPGTPPAWLRRVLERIHGDFRRPLTLAALASEVGVHPAHLARVFRSAQGVTVAAYVRQLRLGSALAALRDSDRPLASIALEAGFADQSHLTRALKAATGTTPRLFREQSRRR